MMIKNKELAVTLFIFCAFALSIFFAPAVFSQEDATGEAKTREEEGLDFDKTYQEYNLVLDEYKKLHTEYVLKRAQYLRFKTLKSKEESFDATLTMLQARDDVVVSYLLALKSRLSEATGVADGKRNALNIRINQKSGWFSEHREVLISAGTLGDLVKDSSEAKEEYVQVITLSYEVLATMSEGKIVDFNERLSTLFEAVEKKLGEIESEEREEYVLSTRKLQVIDRWMFDSENRFVRGEEKQVEAENTLSLFAGQKGSALEKFNRITSTLGEARLFYKEVSTFLKEVIVEIKVADDQ